MTGSLGRRLTVGFVLGWLTLLLLAGLGVYAVLRAGVYDQFDTGLRSRLDAVSILAEQESGDTHFEWYEYDRDRIMSGDPSDGGGEIFRIGRADGGLLARAGPFDDALYPTASSAYGPTPRIVSMTLPDGTAARCITHRFRVHLGTAEPEGTTAELLTVALAMRTRSVEDLLRRVLSILVGVGAATMLVGAAAAWWYVRRGLAPIRPVTAQIDGLDADLNRRVDAGSCPTELRPLVVEINGLLDRLQRKVERETQFVADAAHELRSPIAGVRANLDVLGLKLTPRAQGPPMTAEGLTPALDAARASTLHLEAVCERLMVLAGLESGATAPPREIDVAALVDRVVDEHQDALSWRSLSVVWGRRDGARPTADPVLVELVVRNLVDNAAAHAADGSVIGVAIAGSERAGVPGIRCTVENAVASDATPDADKVMEPFYRGDQARTFGPRPHLGLGLSIAERCAAGLGATLAVAVTPAPPGPSSAGPRFVATLDLPLTPPTGGVR